MSHIFESVSILIITSVLRMTEDASKFMILKSVFARISQSIQLSFKLSYPAWKIMNFIISNWKLFFLICYAHYKFYYFCILRSFLTRDLYRFSLNPWLSLAFLSPLVILNTVEPLRKSTALEFCWGELNAVILPLVWSRNQQLQLPLMIFSESTFAILVPSSSLFGNFLWLGCKLITFGSAKWSNGDIFTTKESFFGVLLFTNHFEALRTEVIYPVYQVWAHHCALNPVNVFFNYLVFQIHKCSYRFINS